ncbi:ArsR family transcriptional regulator [Leptospira gomenensis]|uniref:ArsR family transcriptional regulator n=1 Tax=Leptospira gomenensis TaxID=2484974 RepID=A0A5F1Y8V6_9LEPT|nr:metalloregulator ArsR/SmtB family transcription factor [Leptospira gomenensis]TGK31728.1 ArsR family transcriptional regulator [Leptospira gomenensis]TGK36107.1 ArsR family transcriptional regulator [Leptospira gomenensis]TGK41643.1 ArsR family transcriptional regulator [Leptospira gomenensis]TGK61397.1 ArsR family transcriptional regulator [Leptospira gomenensis]
MALNKKAEFSEDTRVLAEFSKALAHPARLAILQTIAERNECICGEIVDVLPLAQATVSQHLRELKEIGLIQGEIEGKKSCYCVRWARLQELETALLSFLENLKRYKKPLVEDCC